MIERKFRFHANPHHPSNWCIKCGLYYCWHPEVKGHQNDARANHKFEPGTKDYYWSDPQDEES